MQCKIVCLTIISCLLSNPFWSCCCFWSIHDIRTFDLMYVCLKRVLELYILYSLCMSIYILSSATILWLFDLILNRMYLTVWVRILVKAITLAQISSIVYVHNVSGYTNSGFRVVCSSIVTILLVELSDHTFGHLDPKALTDL